MADEPLEELTDNVVHLSNERLSGPPAPSLGRLRPPGGGGSDGLEVRVAVLETHVGHLVGSSRAVEADVKDIRERLIRVEERISHLPTFGQTMGLLATLLALIAAITVFQDSIQEIFSLNLEPGAAAKPE